MAKLPKMMDIFHCDKGADMRTGAGVNFPGRERQNHQF